MGAAYSIAHLLIPIFSFLFIPFQELKNHPITLVTAQKILYPALLNVFFSIIISLFSYLIFVGLVYQIYLVKKGEFQDYKQIFNNLSWSTIGKMIFGFILYSAGTTLGFLALVFPGIILTLVWCLWPFIIFEGNYSAWQAFGESYRRTKKYQLEIFSLLVVAYALESCIIAPVFFLFILIDLGVSSTTLRYHIFGSVFSLGLFNDTFNPIAQNPSFAQSMGFLFLTNLIFLYLLTGILTKIFTMLVIAEIYYRLLPENKAAKTPELN